MEDKLYKILITGGATGLGKMLSEYLSNNRHKVIVIDIVDESDLEKEYLDKIKYVKFDLSKPIELKATINQIEQELGGDINILINNASIRSFKKFKEYTYADISNYIKVNFESVLALNNILIPKMIANRFGRIINISSKSAFENYTSGSIYCSLKSALVTYSEAVAKELKRENANVSMHVFAPGSFSSKNGEKLKNHQFIIAQLLKLVDKIVYTNKAKTTFSILSKFDRFKLLVYRLITIIKQQ